MLAQALSRVIEVLRGKKLTRLCMERLSWCRLKQKHFLGKAARDGNKRSVNYAFRFIEALPRMYTSLATYNMLITVCIQAKDLPAAMQALDLLRANGYKPDSILYNNLITGVGFSFLRSTSQAACLVETRHTFD